MGADKIAKAITAGAGAAAAAYSIAQAGGLTWLKLAGCIFTGAIVGVLTWAVPNAPAAIDPAAAPKA